MDNLNQFFENGFLVFIISTIVSFIFLKLILLYISHLLKQKMKLEIIRKIISITFYVLWAYLLLLQIKPLKNFALSLLASGGVFALIIGFASQESVSNLISGIFIIIFKPFEIGDLIKIENGLISGTVENITLRHTIIRSFENTKQVISNSRINNLIVENISDFSKEKGAPLLISIHYNMDIEKAIQIIENCIVANANVKRKGDVLVSNISATGVEIRCMVFCETPSITIKTLSEIRVEVIKQFQQHNITIYMAKSSF